MDAETAGEEGGQVVVGFGRVGVGPSRPVRIAAHCLRRVSRRPLMRAKLGGRTESFCVGERVQLVSIPLGRGKRLHVGLVGEVVCVGDGWRWVSVIFSGAGPYPYQLRPVHPVLVQRAPLEVAG